MWDMRACACKMFNLMAGSQLADFDAPGDYVKCGGLSKLYSHRTCLHMYNEKYITISFILWVLTLSLALSLSLSLVCCITDRLILFIVA